MVHSGHHPLKHRPFRIVLGWSTVDIILLNVILLNIVLLRKCLDGAQWISSSYTSSSLDSAWMVQSGYYPLKQRLLRIVLGWCTLNIILLNIILLNIVLL